MLILALAATAPVAGVTGSLSIRVDRSSGTADVDAENVNLADLLGAAAVRSGTILAGSSDRTVTVSLSRIPLEGLVERLAAELGVVLEWRGRTAVLIDAAEKRITLDVVDARATELLPRLAAECGIRNVMIDEDIEGSATFRLIDVPCSEALGVVLRTLGLRAQFEPGNLLVVER